VKQLALQQNALPNEVEELFSKHKDGQSSPSLDEYSKVLSQLSNSFKKSFIIVDALDEHANDEEEGCPMQIEFLDQLRQLQQQSNATTSCRLFFTSRENRSIQDQLAGCARIDIRAMDSDIRLFVRSRISDSTKFRFASALQRNEDLACMITDKLAQLAQGMSVSSDITIYSYDFHSSSPQVLTATSASGSSWKSNKRPKFTKRFESPSKQAGRSLR
jgi:hypothetical protein